MPAIKVRGRDKGKRIAGDKNIAAEWEFIYDGSWTRKDDGDVPLNRDGATIDNMFPESRKGCLDAVMLEKLGLNAGRMRQEDGSPDALFFSSYFCHFRTPKPRVLMMIQGCHSSA